MTFHQRLAPAKLNLTLEVLGRRPDGYHEIRSIITTVTLVDTIVAKPGTGFKIISDDRYDPAGMALPPGQLNTVERAILLLGTRLQELRGDRTPYAEALLSTALSETAITLHKRIPAAAGLGGGSSDGAAALLLLNEAWSSGLSAAELHGLAAEIGSDCPFFLEGGVQLMSGRGDTLMPVSPSLKSWFCIVTPPVHRPQKTAVLYSMLDVGDYSDGGKTAKLAVRLNQEQPAKLSPLDLSNVFDAYADRAFGPLGELRAALLETGALAVHLCGAGPSLYGLYQSAGAATRAEQTLREKGSAAWAVSAPM